MRHLLFLLFLSPCTFCALLLILFSFSDFLLYWFRQTNSDYIFVGAIIWIYNNEYSNVISQGIVAIDSTDNDYEIVNIGSKEIYLLSTDLNNIKSNSYFTNRLVNIVIEYLGK